MNENKTLSSKQRRVVEALFVNSTIDQAALAAGVSSRQKFAQALRDGLESTDLNIRLRASSIFLSRLVEFRQLLDLEQRIAALEGQSQGFNRWFGMTCDYKTIN